MKNPTAIKATVKDLVCGMDVETASAAAETSHNGHIYYFCGKGCKTKFDLNPAQYVGKNATPGNGCGCCS